jgi:hypothetical protein
LEGTGDTLIKYVLSADHQVMYSVVHGPPTICDLIHWWADVNQDLCIQATEEYVHLIDARALHAVNFNEVECRNFLLRVSERPGRLPRRSAIWCQREMIDSICRFWQLPTLGLRNEIMAFTDLDIACFWIGATSQQTQMANELLRPATRREDLIC